LKNIEAAYSSQIFGGSALLPVGSKEKKSQKRDKRNPLEEEIKRLQINYLYGGGLYNLKNIQVLESEDAA